MQSARQIGSISRAWSPGFSGRHRTEAILDRLTKSRCSCDRLCLCAYRMEPDRRVLRPIGILLAKSVTRPLKRVGPRRRVPLWQALSASVIGQPLQIEPSRLRQLRVHRTASDSPGGLGARRGKCFNGHRSMRPRPTPMTYIATPSMAPIAAISNPLLHQERIVISDFAAPAAKTRDRNSRRCHRATQWPPG